MWVGFHCFGERIWGMCTAVGRLGGWVKNSGMVSGLYFLRRVHDQEQKQTFCHNAGIVMSVK